MRCDGRRHGERLATGGGGRLRGENQRNCVRDHESDEKDGDADADLAAAELLHWCGHTRVRIRFVIVVCHISTCERGIQKPI